MFNARPLRILIADDSDRVRALVRDQLAPLPYAEVVGEATSTNEALSLVEASEPNVVILDIAMPGSGIRALKSLKQQQPSPRVVMLTNHAGPYYRKICLDGGADFFLDKTVEFERIGEVLQHLADADEADTAAGSGRRETSNGELSLFDETFDRVPPMRAEGNDGLVDSTLQRM